MIELSKNDIATLIAVLEHEQSRLFLNEAWCKEVGQVLEKLRNEWNTTPSASPKESTPRVELQKVSPIMTSYIHGSLHRKLEMKEMRNKVNQLVDLVNSLVDLVQKGEK